ncbi:MAG: (E)-4-hydroxy-3-methylbut-2-enyl-diphosphate synthase [Bacteroidales bacterium]|nr:(E)-4-hydroxy-3-methylbut-2-enyl-diphosphate synthase [Bacteroidales bacterium]
MTGDTCSRRRRMTVPVRIGRVAIGGDNPIAVQSMTNTPTMDTVASADQIIRIAEAGGDIVRLTAQTPAHARNLGEIRRLVRERGCEVPLVADIHYNPAAAFAAAEEVEKVRINPGNFVDPGRKFEQHEYTDEEYAAELARLREAFVPFLDLCASRGVAIRLGVNHGSLSDRIRNRYGDTPEGMVESAMEFLRIAVERGFTDVVISIKSSNVVVMTRTVRLLAETMEREGMAFPLHLGVTEAGDGDDGRIKSAVGIGSLLVDGLGDTIRVSLSEDPEREIPVARKILAHVARTDAPGRIRRAVAAGNGDVTVSYPAGMSPEDVKIAAAVDLGYALLEIEGVTDNIRIEAPSLTDDECRRLELDILQATRRKITKTEYIACPSCGRTLFDLQRALAEVKAATAGLKGLKIGVMGCIVNGPGEMADADYGYVGAGPGRVSLYKGQTCVVKNIKAEEALPRLIQLIKDNGDWPDESV